MFVYICDFFADEILGGCELNDKELIIELQNRGHIVKKHKSDSVTKELIESYKDAYFIISNFMNLDSKIIELLKNKKYIIYEHDHKYISTRNPAFYTNFVCPKNLIVNFEFYKNAAAILSQSKFHKNIIDKNLQLSNVISVGGNLWSIEDLNYMRTISKKQKSNICSILDSKIPHKNTIGAVEYCKKNDINFELIKSNDYHTFLSLLGKNEKFCFIPQTPETLSRVVVEAKMMGVSVIANKLIGAIGEDWFSLSGDVLIEYMLQKRSEVATIIENI